MILKIKTKFNIQIVKMQENLFLFVRNIVDEFKRDIFGDL